MQWLQAFAMMVGATSPRLVVPCDDMAFRLLQMVVLEPPEELRPDVQLQLAVSDPGLAGRPCATIAQASKRPCCRRPLLRSG